jgi:hypothetical protein
MDRRNFFKRFGTVAVVPFVPIKWDRSMEEIAAEIKPSKKTKRSAYALGQTAYSIYIDGIDFTGMCKSIEVEQKMTPIDVTSLYGDDNGYRRLMPGPIEGLIRTRFIMTHDEFWQYFNPNSDTWHHIQIANHAVGVFYNCMAKVTLRHEFAMVGEVVTVNLEFVTNSAIATTAMKKGTHG